MKQHITKQSPEAKPKRVKGQEAGAGTPAQGILQLQQLAGNRAVAQMMRTVSNKPIQLYKVKDRNDKEMDGYDADDLVTFQARLNAIHLVEENPVSFLTYIISNLRNVGKQDDNAQKALEMTQSARTVLIRGAPELDQSGVEDILKLDEFTDLVRDHAVKDKEVLLLAEQAKGLAKQMAQALEFVTNNKDMDAKDKMKYMTSVGDYFLEQVSKEAMGMLGEPKRGMALLATGGFGRNETMPSSDLDFGVIGNDADLIIIRSLTNLMMNKINLARGILAQQLNLPQGVKAGFEADPLWLQSPSSVEPEKVAKNSAIKGTVEDARPIAVFHGSESKGEKDDLIPRFMESKKEVRDRGTALESLSMVVSQYTIPDVRDDQPYNIKDGWLRLITMSMQKLATFYGIDSTTTEDRIAEWGKKAQLEGEIVKGLTESFRILASLRQQLHIFYKGEKDDFFAGPTASTNGLYTLTTEQRTQLVVATDHLRKFMSMLWIFINSKGAKWREKKSFFDFF